MTLQLINTGPEPFFEDVVNHMAAICAVPIAMVAITDGGRQWINQPGQEKGAETPDVAFSHSRVLGPIRAVVIDTAADELCRDLKWPDGAAPIRAFICVSLLIEGEDVGSLYLADIKPRAWSEFEISYMARSSRLVAGHFEARAMLAERNRRIELERQLAEANAVYRAVITSMKEGVIVRSARGEVVTSNEAARTILGVTEAQLRSRSTTWRYVDLDGKPLRRDRRPADIALASGEPQIGKLIGIERPGGEILWLECNCIPMWSGYSLAPTSVVTTFDDITDRKAREDGLKREPSAA